VVVVPGDLQGVHVSQPYDQVMMPTARQTAEAIAWEFAVISDGALAVAASALDTTKPSSAMAPDWDWTGSRWESPGGSRCGGDLGTGEGSPNVTVEFISVCPS
jgi:hypothetical protein